MRRGRSDGGLVVDTDATYDTDLGTFIAGQIPDPVSAVVPQSQGENLRVISVTTLTVTSGVSLRAVGSLPLVVAARGDIEIDGTLDVSDGGAGANSALCQSSAGSAGTDVGDGGGPGGGGGGFGGTGGAGGTGDLNGRRACRRRRWCDHGPAGHHSRRLPGAVAAATATITTVGPVATAAVLSSWSP